MVILSVLVNYEKPVYIWHKENIFYDSSFEISINELMYSTTSDMFTVLIANFATVFHFPQPANETQQSSKTS